MSEYEKQAIDFATKHGIELKVNGNEYGLHFEGDTQERRIFDLELIRNGEHYSFKFGQSINESCKTVVKKQRDVLESIEVYAGLKTVSASFGVTFHVFKKNDFNLSEEDFYKLSKEFKDGYYSAVSVKNAKLVKRFNDGEISKNVLNKRLHNKLTEGAFDQCIQNAIRRELEKGIDTNEISDEVIEPTMYDVLTCLTKYDPESFEDFCDNFGYNQDSISAERVYHNVVEEFENVELLFGDILEELNEIE